MKILITAGGTTGKIDQVRAITNHSTGRLGQALADYLAANPDTTIDYVTTKTSTETEKTLQYNDLYDRICTWTYFYN